MPAGDWVDRMYCSTGEGPTPSPAPALGPHPTRFAPAYTLQCDRPPATMLAWKALLSAMGAFVWDATGPMDMSQLQPAPLQLVWIATNEADR